MIRTLSFALLAVGLSTLACSSDDDGGGSSGGSSGTGGSAGSGTGGSAGSATGGSAGSAGGGAQPQCQSASDCTSHSDCCSCEALGPGEPTPPSCPITCATDRCQGLGLASTDVDCIAGQCVLKIDCDGSKVTCEMAKPICAAGEVPSVNGTCWGGCALASECSVVTDCADCDPASTACVQNVTQLGPEHHCVTVPSQCGSDTSCACMGSAVCIDPFSSCSDQPGQKTLSCSCPNC